MKNSFILIIALLLSSIIIAQETKNTEVDSVKHFNLIKIGLSGQVDVYYFGGYYYYDDIYYGDGYHDYYYYPDGPNSFLYLAYEHIWEFPNKIAIALEPKAGISFREYANHFAVGNDTKFYWTNKEFWRMGIALSSDYIFGSRDTYRMIPMDDGNYRQRKQITMYYHNLSFDIGIIPFQFKLKKAPIIIESQFSLTGFSVLMERSENYTNGYGDEVHTYDASLYPYFLKGEFKIGYIFP